MKVTLKGLDKAIKRLNKMPEKLDKGMKTAITKAVIHISGESVRKAPVKTSTLRRSITKFAKKNKVKKSGGKWVGYVGTKLKYAPHQEYGTKRGIRPKLFFTTSIKEGQKYLSRLLKKALRSAIM